jgi:hypothetical protein
MVPGQIYGNALEQAPAQVKTDYTQVLSELDPKAQKIQVAVLTSLQAHWAGLTVFVTNPVVPMDNNLAERTIRGAILGRNNYFGSGAIWSAELAAQLFSILPPHNNGRSIDSSGLMNI